MKLAEKILSVGIDVGTTTTQLIFSELLIENTASDFSVPCIKIIDKKIIYRSEIYFTPLITPTKIDVQKIKELIEHEYQKGKIAKSDISTGAVIITGETARKENSESVLNSLSDFAGDFVVATAGPELESILAGRGAGADIESKSRHEVVANVDIGGGTTNISVFKNGEVIDTCCLDIGGRLIKVDKTTHRITYISKKIQKLIEINSLNIHENSLINNSELMKLTKILSSGIGEVLNVSKRTELSKYLVTDKTLREDYKIDHVMFSGGVADCIYKQESKEAFEFGDIGVSLGKSISDSFWIENINVIDSIETIRATVIGAGNHTTTISGSTILYSTDVFPLKNIPVVSIDVGDEDDELRQNELIEVIETKIKWFELSDEQQLVALSINGNRKFSFKNIEEMADVVLKGMNLLLVKDRPIIIIVEKDVGKILGLMIQKINVKNNPLICIDSIRVRDGDYIDIGTPLSGGKVVPVVVKTLALGY